MKNRKIYGLALLGALLLASCSKEESIADAPSGGPFVQLSVPDAAAVSVYSAASSWESMINAYQLFVYRGSGTTSAPVYTQSANSSSASDILENGTISPRIALRDYTPQNGDRIYLVCNLTKDGAAVLSSSILEQDLLEYKTADLLAGQSLLVGGGLPMSGEITWRSSGLNICDLLRCRAKVTVDVAPGLFPGKQVTWFMQCYEYTTLYRLNDWNNSQLYRGAMGYVTSPDFDLFSAETSAAGYDFPITAYYPSEYQANNAVKNLYVSEYNWHADRVCVFLRVTDPTDNSTQYYRLELVRDPTFYASGFSNNFIPLMRNTHYRYYISKVLSEGYSTLEEARNTPGNNLWYMIKTILDGEYISNGSYALRCNDSKIRISPNTGSSINSTIIYLSTPNNNGWDSSNITTRKVEVFKSDKTTRMPAEDFLVSQGSGGFNPYPNDGSNNLSPTSSDFFLYFKSGASGTFDGGYVKVTVGNLVKWLPIEEIQ